MIRLPDQLRDSFSEPIGPVFADTNRLLAAIGSAETPSSDDATPAESDSALDTDETSRLDTTQGGDSNAESTLDVHSASVSAFDAEADLDSDPVDDGYDHTHEQESNNNRDSDHDNADFADVSGRDVSPNTDGTPILIAVGDIVTYHLLEAGVTPELSVIDGRTEREVVDPDIAARLQETDASQNHVANPPAELSRALLIALRDGIRTEDPTIIVVDGEEDLATLPAMLAAPLGSSVVYGQPGEGMVHVGVDEATTAEARRLLARFDGNTESALTLLER